MAAVAALVAYVAGCTATEWGNIRDDALGGAPNLINRGLEGGADPLGWGWLLITYVAGLVSKSAARGFGKGASAAGSGMANLLSKWNKKD